MKYRTKAMSTDEATVNGSVIFQNSEMLSGLGKESNIIVIIMLSEQNNRVEAEEEEERQ